MDTKLLWSGLLYAWAALHCVAFAQSPNDADRVKSFLEDRWTVLGQAKSNLIQMEAGLPGHEADSAAMISAISDVPEGHIRSLSMLLIIYAAMINDTDRNIVRKFVVLDCKAYDKQSDISLKSINRNLARLKSPAAISEATKMRDALQEIKERLAGLSFCK